MVRRKNTKQYPNAICPNQTSRQTNTNEFQNIPYSPISKNNILLHVSITSLCNSELCLAMHFFLLFFSQHLSNDCLHCSHSCVWTSPRQASPRFQQANVGTASKRVVIPQDPTWACLPSVQVFLGIFNIHLGSLWKWTLRKCNTYMVAFAGQMILSDCCSPGDTKPALSHMSKTSDCWVLWLEVLLLRDVVDCHAQPAQHCATAQVPGSVA